MYANVTVKCSEWLKYFLWKYSIILRLYLTHRRSVRFPPTVPSLNGWCSHDSCIFLWFFLSEFVLLFLFFYLSLHYTITRFRVTSSHSRSPERKEGTEVLRFSHCRHCFSIPIYIYIRVYRLFKLMRRCWHACISSSPESIWIFEWQHSYNCHCLEKHQNTPQRTLNPTVQLKDWQVVQLDPHK